MIIYIVVFFISIVFFWLSENVKMKDNNRGKIIRNICVFCAILIPSLLAGFRDDSIGTDTKAYKDFFYYSYTLDSVKEALSIKEY